MKFLRKARAPFGGGSDLNGKLCCQGASRWEPLGECPNAGVVMAADGVATFRATGAGSFTADGRTSFRGVTYFQSKAPLLSALNGKAVVYSWEVDAAGVAAWELRKVV